MDILDIWCYSNYGSVRGWHELRVSGSFQWISSWINATYTTGKLAVLLSTVTSWMHLKVRSWLCAWLYNFSSFYFLISLCMGIMDNNDDSVVRCYRPRHNEPKAWWWCRRSTCHDILIHCTCTFFCGNTLAREFWRQPIDDADEWSVYTRG
jgi:hypothetical protein